VVISSVQVGAVTVPVKTTVVGPYDSVHAVCAKGCVIFSVHRNRGWLTVMEEIARVTVPNQVPGKAFQIEVH